MPRFLGVLLVVGACGGDGDGGPRIDSIAPAEAPVAATVEILGGNFCGGSPVQDGACLDNILGFVTLGSNPGVRAIEIASWRDTRISFQVPSGVTGPTSIVVSVDGTPSNAKEFEVLP